MSDVIASAVEALSAKMSDGFNGSAKFEIAGEGAIVVDSDGVRAGDEDTDVTMSADADVFQAILEGDMNPTTAFMTGKLKVSGDMGMAMKLAGALG